MLMKIPKANSDPDAAKKASPNVFEKIERARRLEAALGISAKITYVALMNHDWDEDRAILAILRQRE